MVQINQRIFGQKKKNLNDKLTETLPYVPDIL